MASVGTKCTELKKEKTNLSIDHAAERINYESLVQILISKRAPHKHG